MATLTQLMDEWTAAGHAEPGAWYHLLGLIGPWIVLGVLLALIVSALVRAPRYRAVAVLGEAERERLRAALREAERRTVGEIVPVVVERSDPHPAAEWLAALAFLLVASGTLAPHLPWRSPAAFLAAQLLFGALGFALARFLPAFQRMFVFEARATAVAGEQACQEFFRQGLFTTRARTGVLVFVSLLERRVVVLADEGIAAAVAPGTWQEVDEAVLAGIRRGSLCDGLLDGIARAGRVLSEHFPWTEGDRNELPDRLIVRRE